MGGRRRLYAVTDKDGRDAGDTEVFITTLTCLYNLRRDGKRFTIITECFSYFPTLVAKPENIQA